jgi:hypothetical protein
MKKLILALLISVSFLQINAQPQWTWVNSINGNSSQIGPAKIAAKPSGGFLITGSFSGTQMFGTISLTAAGAKDAYLANYDNLGNCLWATKFGSPLSNTTAKAIAIDGMGNAYIAGTYTDTMVVGGTTLPPYGVIDMFLIKVDQSGTPIWSKRCGGQGADNATALAIDNADNVYMGGTFFFKAYFDTDSIGNNILHENIVIAKYSASGQLQWLKDAGGMQDDACTGLSVSNNRLYMTGNISGSSCIFAPNSVSAANTDGFIAKYNLSTGMNLWVKKAGGPQNDNSTGLGTDQFGNAYMVGNIIQNCSFGNGIVINAGNFDQMYIAKYDSLGNCLWAKKGGNPGVPNSAGGIVTDINGASMLLGSFKGTATFSPFNITSTGNEEACFVKYSPNGTCQYALKAGGAGSDFAYSGAWLPANELVVTGTYQSTATFGTITINTPPGASYATFLGYLPGTAAAIESNNGDGANFIVGPNPASNTLNVNFTGFLNAKNAELINATGQSVLTQSIAKNETKLVLNVSDLQAGYYIVKINNDNTYITKSIQIIK